jgi:hypothetical protein
MNQAFVPQLAIAALNSWFIGGRNIKDHGHLG